MDVKPGNILLDESFNARLGDPGLARQLKPGVTHASVTQACGTRGYIDPLYEDSEQFRPVNDVFSFGVGMYTAHCSGLNIPIKLNSSPVLLGWRVGASEV